VGVCIKNRSLLGETLSGVHGSKKGLIYNDFEPEKKTLFFITESFDDSLSYYQLHRDKFNGYQPVLSATAGEPRKDQFETLNKLIKDVSSLKIISGFDNDLNGARFTCNLVGTIKPLSMQNTADMINSYSFQCFQRDSRKNGLIKFENI